MYYAYFILTEYAAQELNQNYDDMYCVTGVTGSTGTVFYTQDTKFNIPEEFGYAVDDAQSESEMKRAAASWPHPLDMVTSL